MHVTHVAFCLDFVSRLSHHKPTFPSRDDLSGAATALMRLQNTYRLMPSALVDGRIPGDQKEKMSASDCYYLGLFSSTIALLPVVGGWLFV